MKNAKLLGFMLMMVASVAQLQASSIVALSDLKGEEMTEFCQGKMSDVIVECPQETTLPLKMSLKGEFLTLDSSSPTQLYLKVLKSCYIRCEKAEEFLFSSDVQTWKKFSDFFKGEIKGSVGTENGAPVTAFELEINQR